MSGIGIGISPALKRRSVGTSVTPIGALSNYHRFYGDSISINEAQYSAAGHCTSGQGGYTTRTQVAKNIVGEWRALSSSTMWYHVSQVYTYTDIQSNESASYMGGINNIRGDGDNIPVLEGMLTGGLVAILSCHFAKSVRFLHNFTSAGAGWVINNFVSPRYASYFVGSNNIGDTLTGEFEGSACSIGALYSTAGTYGFEVRVDGNLVKTVNVTNYDGTVTGGDATNQSPYCTLLTGFTNTLHTIELKIISGSGTDYLWFDSLFELPEFNDPYIQPFVWLQIPHANSNYWGTDAPPYNKGNNTIVDNCNSAMEAAVTYFKGYSQFGIVRTNNWYNANDPAQGSTADGPYALHPGCLGSQYISNGFQQLVDSYITPSEQPLLTSWLSSLVGAQPNATQKYNLNYAIELLEEAGILDEADVLHILSGLSTSEQILTPLITTGSTPFTSTDTLVITGAAGNGSSTYTNFRYAPATNGVKYTQNNCSLFIYNNSAAASSNFLCGSWDSGSKAVGISPQAAGLYGSINSALYEFNTIVDNPSTGNSKGMFGMVRTGANVSKFAKNGIVRANSVAVSSALDTLNLFGNALNFTGAAAFFYVGEISFLLIGSGNIDYKRVDSIFKWYKRRVGF